MNVKFWVKTLISSGLRISVKTGNKIPNPKTSKNIPIMSNNERSANAFFCLRESKDLILEK